MNKKPNIILITIDCLRADYCGWLNPEHKELTPFLNKFAKESIVFSQAYATGPNTPLAFPGILSGTYPSNFAKLSPEPFPGLGQRPYLPKILQDNGYFTMAAQNNLFISSYFGYDQGFNIFKDLGLKEHNAFKNPISTKKREKELSSVEKLNRGGIFNFIKRFFYEKIINLYDFLEFITPKILPIKPRYLFFTSTAEEINESIMENVGLFKKPLFLWVHYMDVHEPYFLHNIPGKTDLSILSKKEAEQISTNKNKLFSSKWGLAKGKYELLKKFYQLNIKYLDGQIEFLFSHLKKELENSIVVIVADHGEEFNEHNDWGHVPSIKNNKLYKELLHVPLLIRMPNRKSLTINGVRSCAQIPATILELAGLQIHPEMEKSLFNKKKFEAYSETVVPVLAMFNRVQIKIKGKTKII